MAIQFLNSPNVRFCTTWEKLSQQNIIFLLKAVSLLNQNNTQTHILSTFFIPLAKVHPIVYFYSCLQWKCSKCRSTGTETLSPYVDSSIDNVLFQTNPDFTSRFLNSSTCLTVIRCTDCCMTVKLCRPAVGAADPEKWNLLTFCLFILTFNSPVLLFPGSAESDVRRDGNVNGHLMASWVKNILVNNY